MKDIIKRATTIELFNDNTSYIIDDIKEKLIDLLDGAYSTPSYISVDNNDIVKAKEKDLWIELSFENTETFNDYPFDKLLLQLKPKYNFINLIRHLDGQYTGRCITFNLAKKTTDMYKELTKNIKG